jgi:hypothetical protein
VTPTELALPSQSGKQPATIPNSVAASAAKPNSTVPPREAVPVSHTIAAQAPDQTRRPDQTAPDQTRDASSIAIPFKPLSTDTSSDHRATKPNITPVPPFRSKSSPSPRDILDVSHVHVTGTTDVQPARAAISRYGQLPGGIVVEGVASCEMPILSLAIDPSRPTHLVINNSLEFDTGLSAEEVAILWQAVLEEGHATNDFGVLSQRKAIGVSNDTVVAVTMMKADNVLGGIIYGYDSQYRVGNPAVPFYRNPFTTELTFATVPEVVNRLFFNYLENIYPYIVLTITDVHFVKKSPDVIRVNSCKVTAVLTAINEHAMPVTSIDNSVAAARFPFAHEALQYFLKHFSDYARVEPHLARTLAYAELVCLLRRAKAANASLSGKNHVLSLVAKRQQVPLPRFDHSLRSEEFVTVVADTARRLARTDSTSSDGLMSAVVGFRYATLAGDFDTFVACKRKALQCISFITGTACRNEFQRQFFLKLLALAERIETFSHDILIDNYIGAAFSCRTQQEKDGYLQDAQRLYGPWVWLTQDSTTRCRQLEITSYLQQTFDPVPGLGRVRVSDPSSIQPFSVLKTINIRRRRVSDTPATPIAAQAASQRRKEQLGFAKLAKQDAELWNTIEAGLSIEDALWLLDEIQRLDIAVSDYLTTFRKDVAVRPLEVLSQLVAKRLKPLPATSFSARLLHRDNPFFASQELFEHETPDTLAQLFVATQAKMAWFDPAFNASGKNQFSELVSGIRRTDLDPLSPHFFQRLASSSKTDGSEAALMLAYEIKVRAVTVQQLHEVMRRHWTVNPQAALFFFDLEVAEEARKTEDMYKFVKQWKETKRW